MLLYSARPYEPQGCTLTCNYLKTRTGNWRKLKLCAILKCVLNHGTHEGFIKRHWFPSCGAACRLLTTWLLTTSLHKVSLCNLNLHRVLFDIFNLHNVSLRVFNLHKVSFCIFNLSTVSFGIFTYTKVSLWVHSAVT